MAYLVRRSADRVEIRESRATERGPRSRMLASFTGALTPEVVEQAAGRATRPFDRRDLARRARAAGVAVDDRPSEGEARALLARLRRRDAIAPVMAGLLMRALENVVSVDAPEELADVAVWIGASQAERGAALRDLLDTFDRIAASRQLPRTPPRTFFPHFESSSAVDPTSGV